MSKRQSKVSRISPRRKSERPKEPHDALGNPINHYVKFYLADLKEPVCYKVHKNDWDHASQEFWEHRDPDKPRSTLVGFIDIYDDTLVRVNRRHVLLYQALYDIGRFEKTDPPDLPRNRVNIYLAGLQEPLYFDNMENEDIAALNEGLDCFFGGDQEFVSFVDQDGEDNSIRVDSITLIETPNLAMFDGAVVSWNPATQEYEDPHVSENDEDVDEEDDLLQCKRLRIS
jgi:hypothetical protein